jgi:uncharacterized protein (DUF305 family)
MHKFSVFCAAGALFAAASLAATLPAAAQADHGMSHGAMSGASEASKAYVAAMDKMDVDMKRMAMTGKPGVDFAAMMIPHHQAAIDMAKAYLASGEKDAELVKLSQDIIAAQEREIGFLRKWLATPGR